MNRCHGRRMVTAHYQFALVWHVDSPRSDDVLYDVTVRRNGTLVDRIVVYCAGLLLQCYCRQEKDSFVF